MNFAVLMAVIYSILNSIGLGGFDITFLIILIIIGVIIIVLIKLFLVLIPAIIVAAIVYFLTGDLFWTGIAFLVVALLSLIPKSKTQASTSPTSFNNDALLFFFIL
jgi:hypothetical protein